MSRQQWKRQFNNQAAGMEEERPRVTDAIAEVLADSGYDGGGSVESAFKAQKRGRRGRGMTV